MHIISNEKGEVLEREKTPEEKKVEELVLAGMSPADAQRIVYAINHGN